MKKLLQIFLSLISFSAFSQGYNHQWLLGSYLFLQDPKGRILFDTNTYTLFNENRKMVFNGTEGNISDANGNLLMSSNGAWIANATGDTMMNGSGLNPSTFSTNWSSGFPFDYINVILPYPGDSSKYVLFHKTLWGTLWPAVTGFYKSTIDMSLDTGLGGVIDKNDTLLSDTLSWGIGACKHANGIDWWVIVIREYAPIAYTFLLTPNGIDTMFTQNLNFISNTYGVASAIVFSQDGKKMIYCTPINQTPSGTVLLYDFDRCTGLFSNLHSFALSPGAYLWGLAFSPSGKFAYACTSNNIYQISVDSLTYTTVATYDGFISTGTCCATTFWGMYLAANGKIYITSGSGVYHIHEMNYPDSAGIACDVQQHAIGLPYRQLRAVPNHPNYYLGCDTTSGCQCLATGINNLTEHDFRFRIYPNPVSSASGGLNIGYQLPQNKSGLFQIYDITGKNVFKYVLPPWSNEQSFKLPELADGIYNCVISSVKERASKKIAVINE